VTVITSATGTFSVSLTAPNVKTSGTHTVYAIKTLSNTQVKQINVVINP
jgi:hypothetical protein